MHLNDVAERLTFKLQDPPKLAQKTKPSPPPKTLSEKNEKTNKVANNSVKKEQSKPTAIANKKTSLSKLKSVRLARQRKAAAKSKNVKQKKTERVTTNVSKRSSFVGFVNPLAALDFSTLDNKIGDNKRNQLAQLTEQQKPERTTTNASKRSSFVGFVNPLAALDFSTPGSEIGDTKRSDSTQPLENAFVKPVSVADSSSKDAVETSVDRRLSSVGFVNSLVASKSSLKTSINSSSTKNKSIKRSSLVGFVNPLASGVSIKASENVFSSPQSHSQVARKSVAMSTEKMDAMKYARSLSVFVGPDDAILLKKYIEEDKGVFEAQLMEKTGEVQVNMIVTPSEIGMTEIRSEEISETKRKKWTMTKRQKKKGESVLKTIPLATITNMQESMAPGAFTLYLSTGQAVYMICKQRGLLLGCIKAFQARDKSSSSGW